MSNTKKMPTGQQLYDLLVPHKGEKYVFGALVPKNNAKWVGPWDCAEFVCWGLYQVAKIAYGWANNKGKPETADAYTGYLARDAEKIGVKISIDEANRTPGAVLLRIAGNGAVGHTAITDGRGGTIEAHSTKVGVTKSVVSGRRWDYGILVPGIEFEALEVAPVNVKPAIIYRFTKPVMTGPVVTKIQSLLRLQGYYRMKVDGKFEGGTHEAVKAFQVANGLNPDGEVGPKTAKALNLTI